MNKYKSYSLDFLIWKGQALYNATYHRGFRGDNYKKENERIKKELKEIEEEIKLRYKNKNFK